MAMAARISIDRTYGRVVALGRESTQTAHRRTLHEMLVHGREAFTDGICTIACLATLHGVECGALLCCLSSRVLS